MDDITAEQLERVAKWLGHDWNYCPRPYKNAPYGHYLTKYGSQVSDADLFCAIDDRCVALGLWPLILCDTDGGRIYVINDGNADMMYSGGSNSSRLSSALSAVLKLIEAQEKP